MDRAYSPINNLLEQAACIARRSKETAGEIEPTEGYKRRQINELIKFTNNRNLWVNLSRLTLTYMDKGGENEVFHDGKVSVIKLNNFEYAGDDLEYYHEKYGSWMYGLNKLYLLMEKQHNRGQEGAGLACVKLEANAGEEYMFRERAVGTGAITEIFAAVHEHYKDLTPDSTPGYPLPARSSRFV
jgi:hypothetical protein